MALDTNVNDEINNIMDCFAGADGGVAFVQFRGMMEQMKKEDSESAREIEAVVRKFSKLSDIASKWAILCQME